MSEAMSVEAEQPAAAPHARVVAGKYEVIEELGASTAGTVFTVRHMLLDSICTLTLLPEGLSGDAERLARIQDALRRGCQLRHDHIAPLLDLGQESGRYHLIEAAVDGDPLDQLIRATGPLTAAEALPLARQLADALAHAHERGLLHDALTPSRVVVQRGTPLRAVLRGFGTSALADAPALAYAAPERLAGEPASPQSDVFALGLLLFEMLEGRPFLAGDAAAIRSRLIGSDEPLLPKFSRIAPAGVAGLVARALRRAPRARQQGMVELRNEIDGCLRRLGQARLEAKDKRPIEARAPRKVVMVVDDALLDDGGTETMASAGMAEEAPEPTPRGGESAEAAPARGHRRATATGAPARAETAVAARVFAAGRSTPGARAGVPVAGKVLIGAVVLALAWPMLRSIGVVPARTVPPVEPARPPVVEVQPTPLVPVLGPPLAAPAAVEPPQVAAPRVEVAEPSPATAPIATATVAATAAPAARNVAPRIVSQRPQSRGPIAVMETRSVDFAVSATDKNPDDRIVYTWFLDGKRVARGASWRLATTPGSAGTTRTVEVQAADRAGAKARVTWKVQVTARMTDVNVREWLGRVATAWERNDVAMLRLYGIETPAPKKAGLLGWLSGRRRVSISNEAIRTDGRYASVAFDVSEVDRRGTVLSTRREAFELEKQPNGFVGLRAR
jgi:serine/threonine protein kinase